MSGEKQGMGRRKGMFARTALATMVAIPLAEVSVFIASEHSHAEEFSIDPLIITARKRTENAQEIPFSVRVIGEDELPELGITDLESLSYLIPSFTVQNLGEGQSQVAIRGISAGEIFRDQPGIKEQVGIYLDESVVSMSRYTPEFDMFDMGRVEVLRGPQGTLFGSGSLSGTVRYITNDADLEHFAATIEGGIYSVSDGGVGNELKGMVNLPLTDYAALRLVGYTSEQAGFIDAVLPDNEVLKDVNDGDRLGVRASLLLQPSPYLKITPRVVYQKEVSNGFNREDDFNILANEYTTSRLPVDLTDYQQYLQLQEKYSDEFALADLKVEWELRGAILTSVTSWLDRDIAVRRDSSSLFASVTGGSIRWPESVYTIPAPLDDITQMQSVSQEVRLSSKGEGPIEWVAGGFYSHSERNYSQSLTAEGFEAATAASGLSVFDVYRRNTAGVLSSENELFYSDIPYELDQMALFGEIDYALTDKLTLTGGLRWFDFTEERTLNRDGILANQVMVAQKDSTSSSGFSPRIMARYDLSKDISLNAQISKGFRLGGINDPLNLGACSGADRNRFSDFLTQTRFDDENVTNFEIGSKLSMLNGQSLLNFSLFYSDVENLQATVDAGSCSSRVVVNVPKAYAAGVEFELSANLTDNFEFSLSGSYINSELDSTIVDADGNVIAGLRKGNRLPTVPEFQAALSGTFYFDWTEQLEGAATLSLQHVGERHTQFTDLDPDTASVQLSTSVGDISDADSLLIFDPELDAYNIANLRLSASAYQWRTSVFVNNLTDEKAELSLDRERGFAARLGHTVSQPRTYGVSVNYSF